MPRFLARKRPRLAEALDVDHFKPTHYFRRTGGAINKILQHNGRVVVCSNTAGGNMTTGVPPDPYNKAGTLISWSKRHPLKILDLEQGCAKNLYGTHFSVHCIAYDPISNTLASSGADKNVRTWTFEEVADEEIEDEEVENEEVEDEDDDKKKKKPYKKSHSYQYKVKSKASAPHDLAFKPGESILAIGEKNLTIENITTGSSHPFPLLSDKSGGHVTGAIEWGCGPSSSFVFALSEPIEKNHRHGYHMAFDTDTCKSAFKLQTDAGKRNKTFEFDATGAGDNLCVNSTGTTVALVTNDSSDSFLRIYDVARKQEKSVQKQSTRTPPPGRTVQNRCLDPFTSEGREVNSMAFSPDSVYLAIGRDDNCTHVYDTRMLESGILFDFQHSRTQFTSPDQYLFGVIGVEWLESRSNRLGLVTGGNDGCVRLWDPLRAKDEGTVLAQANSDLAYFTLGDPLKGEHGLIWRFRWCGVCHGWASQHVGGYYDLST
ncbi:WD40-repeat-containing domain protein [Mycena rosella]|uniref:WD40-repeat-containing domain protein n=1 Tax=Mycena rosella TaxID=1033263 RepID=A0AAD7DVR8_MYCRO|nr:WD40-repeat-containing domain protein [Mycena rosella]